MDTVTQYLKNNKSLSTGVAPVATANNIVPVQPKQASSGIDNDVVNLARAIREHESGGNYKAVGDAGTSKGAFQFQPATWKGYAKDVLGDANAPMTAENQNAVAYGKMKEWKDVDKLDVAGIAAKWNSGKATGWENKVGTTTINGQKIKYDTPSYVASVIEIYQKNKLQNPTEVIEPEVSQENVQQEKQNNNQGNYRDIPYISKIPYVGNVVNTGAKGIVQAVQGVKDSYKSFDEGDLSGYGRNILRSASGVADFFSSPVIGAFQTASNTGVGDYTVGKGVGAVNNFITKPITDAISDNKSIQKFATDNPNAEQVFSDTLNVAGSFIGGKKAPEIKTVLTDTTSTVLNKGKSILESQIQKHIDDLEQVYTNLESNTQAGKRKISKIEQKTDALNKAGTEGNTPQKTLAESGIIPEREGIRLNTFEQSQKYIDDFQEVMSTSKDAIKKVGLSSEPIPLELLRKEALDRINTPENVDAGKFKALKKEIDQAFDDYHEAYPNGNIPLSKVDDIKSARFDNAFKNKDFQEIGMLKKDADYAIGKTMQKKIEEVARKAGHEDVAQLNRVIGDRIDAAKFLQKLDGKVIKGGRLMKYITTIIGASMGQSALGKVIGAYAGNIIGELIIAKNVATPLKRLVLRNLKTKNPESYLKTIEWLKKQDLNQETRLLLEAPKGYNTKINQGRAIQEVPINADYIGKDTVIQSKSPINEQTRPAISKVNNILDSLSQNTTDRNVKNGNVSKDADVIVKAIDSVDGETKSLLLDTLREYRPKLYREVIETENLNRYNLLNKEYGNASIREKMGVKEINSAVNKHIGEAFQVLNDPDMAKLLNDDPKGFIKQTLDNIVMGLEKDAPSASKKIASIDVLKVDSIAQLGAKIESVLNKPNGYIEKILSKIKKFPTEKELIKLIKPLTPVVKNGKKVVTKKAMSNKVD